MPPTLPEEVLSLIFDHLAMGPYVDYYAQFVRDMKTGFTGGVDNIHYDPHEHDEYEPPGPFGDNPQRPRRWWQDEYERTHDYYIPLGVTTLYNLCLASKTFHRLAWPVLYRSFDDKAFQLLPYLRTIALKPGYGMALRALRSSSWKPLEGLEAHEILKLLQTDATLTALFQWRARGFWLGEGANSQERAVTGTLKPALLRSLNLGSQDGHLVLLLLMCPNIREMDLSPPLVTTSVFTSFLKTVLSKGFQSQSLPETDYDFEQEESDYALAQMFGAPWPPQILRKPQVLQQIRSLTVRYPGITDNGPSIFLDLLSIPSLSNLHFNSLIGRVRGKTHNSCNFWTTSDECRSLETLELEDCALRTNELAAIICRCPQMTTLNVQWASVDDVVAPTGSVIDEPWCLRYGEVGEAIAEHAPKMRSLTLDNYGGWQSMDAELEHPYILDDSLASLPDLKYLVLDETAIWGSPWGQFGRGLAKTIPKGLHCLTIKSPPWEHQSSNRPDSEGLSEFHALQDAEINDLLQNKNFPELTNVKIAGRLIRFDHDSVLRYGWKSSSYDDEDGAGVMYKYHNFYRKANP